MFRLQYILYIFIFTCISSCEYDLNSKYYPDIQKPTNSPEVNFELSIDDQTIYCYGSIPIRFSRQQGNYSIYSVKFIIDSKEYEFNHNDSAFYYSFDSLNEGDYAIEIIITTNTASQSMADILGVEGYVFNIPYTLKKINITKSVSSISKVQNDGLLISWTHFKNNNLGHFKILKYATNEIFTTTTDSLFDQNYGGENGSYYIYVVDKDGNEYLWATGKCSNLPKLNIGLINNKLALIWNKPPFADRIAEYQIDQAEYWGSWKNIAVLSNQDTSFILPNYSVGENTNFLLRCPPKYYSYVVNNGSVFSTSFSGNLALPGPKFSNYHRISDSGFYFDSQDTLFKYDIPTSKLIALRKNPFAKHISPNAKFLLIADNDLKVLQLYQLDPYQYLKSIRFQDLDANITFCSSPKISDNGIFATVLNNYLYVYNFTLNKLIAKQNLPYNYPLKISPNGDYLSMTRNDSLILYSLGENDIALIAKSKAGKSIDYTNYDFCPNQQATLYLYEQPNIIFKNCIDLSTIRSFSISSNTFMNIDFSTNRVFTVSSGFYRIYNLNTGTLEVSISSSLVGSPNYNIMCNNIIFYSGYRYYLTE